MAKKKIDWEKLQNDINAGKFGSGAITTTRSAKSLRQDVDSGKIKSVTNNNNLAPIKHEDNTTYKNTGKKIGDYIKGSSMKNYDIFQKGNKFYYYDNKNKNYKEITNKTGYSVQNNENTKDKKMIAPVSEHFTNKQQVESVDGKFEPTQQTVKAREDKLGLADRLSVEFSGKSNEDKQKMENELVQQAKNNSRITGAVKGLTNNGYIKAGAFDDGYQFGDVTKTVGSTLLSGLNSIGRGTIRTVEGIGDAATYILAGAGDAIGLDGMANSMKEFAKRDLTNEITMPSSESAWGEGSVLGEKSDSIVESIGGFLPNVALGGVASTTKGATALSSGTMFTSSYGQGISEAYEGGATDEEAQKYGLINGIANTATEMMFGGLGKGTKALGFSHGILDNVDDALAQKVTNAFSSQLAKNLTQYTIKATGEGIEEIAAGLLQGIGKKMTFESEKDLNEILNDEQLLDQFIGGAVASGIMQAPGLVKNTKHGRDLTTGFTNNEKKVFENVSNARFEQELQNNTDMSKTEQNKLRTSIEKQTKSDIENGNLSIREIQNALGNDDYQAYQQETQKKQELEKQLKELQKKSSADMSYSEYNENNQKMADLQSQIDSINLDDLKFKVDTPIESRIDNNDYLLQRSYNNYQNNQAQKGVAFKHEVSDNTKISTLEKNVYDSASKVMNNTKESHNLADFVSKLSKDTGIQYEFTNTEDLKNRGYEVKDRVINGLNTDDGKILINIDSDSIINRVVGHETTHLFENTEDYKKFQNEVFEYAKTKGDFDKLKSELTEAYKNVKGANIDNELTSELVGQYVFSDTEFVQNLSKHRNIFQKVYDEIKHLYKMATAGSKEARQLEKVKRTFEKAYQNNEAKASIENKYSIGGIKAIRQMKDSKYKSDALNNYEKALELKKDGVNNEQIRQKTKWFQDKYGKWKFEFDDSSIKIINNIKQNSTYQLNDIISHDYLFELYPELSDYNVSFTNKKNGATTYYSEKSIEISNSLLGDRKQLKGTLLHEIQHIIQHEEGFNTGTNTRLGRRRYANRLGEIEAADTKQRYMNDMSKENRMRTAPESSKSNPTHPQRDQILSKMNKVEKKLNSLYDIFRGESDEIFEVSNNEDTQILRGRSRHMGSIGDKSQKFTRQRRVEEGLGNSSFSVNSSNVETTTSNNIDSQGRTLTKQQQEFFKDSKARDENGNLKVLYHGTPNEFNKFSYEFLGTNGTMLGKGFYLTDDINVARAYANKSNNGKVMELYTNITKPLKWGKTSITKSEYQSFVEKVNEETNGTLFADYSGEYSEKGSELYNSTLNDILMDYEYGGDDIDLVSGILNSTGMSWDKGYKILTDTTGFDGIIVTTDVYDSGEGNVYIPFQSNQIKNIDNSNPTSNDDIRYSLNNDNLVPLQDREIQSQDVKLENRPIAPINKSLNNPDKNKTKNVKDQNNTKVSKVNLPTKKVSETEFKKDIKANAKKMSNTINSIIDSNTMTVKSDLPDLNIRSWVETAIESDVVDNKILLDDINMLKATYEVKSNKKSLEKANNQINLKGYDQALQDFNSLLTNEKANISVENIVMGERLVQEAMKSNDYKTAQELIENIAILGTELGQKVQALSVIQRLTPEGQLRMLTKTVQRAKIKGDKAFDNVQISPEMTEKVLSTYNQDGTWDQDKLNEAVEEVKGEIAEQMTTTIGEKANAWRYLSMLGNPKTHIRNLISNVAMKATRKYKNFIARSIETGVRKIQNARGKETTANSRTFTKPSEFITKYSEDTTNSLREVIQESNKYDEATELNRMKTIFDKGKVTKATEKILSRIKNDKVEFQNGFLEKVYRFNSDMLQKEDWWFSSSAFRDTLTEYLTANNIRTQEDLDNNPQIVERAKAVALEESQKATFQQYSWIASKINQMEHKNVATQLVVGGMIPFKKTPINIAKAGLSYSPIGLTKSLTYDLYQVKNGNMEASQAIDNMSQGVAGTSLMLLGYVLAKAGVLNGAGDDDKKGKYDNQLGTQSYSIRIGDSTYSLNWLSPVAMPLFVGVNFQDQLEEQEEWDMNVLTGALAQTLDPLTEMSVLQSLNQALSSYNSDDMVGGNIGYAVSSAFESYLTQFLPTASSYLAGTIDDKKRTTTPSADSKFKQGEAILNQIKYKIPGLRQTLPVSQDIWGNETKQADNVFQRAFENFLLPASKKKDISDVVDDEIINLYNETGETGIIPSTPPKYLQYEDEKYNFSSKEYTNYRKTYGTTAKEGLRDLFNSQEYINASNDDKVKYIEDVYDYAREKSKVNYFKDKDVSYEASPSYEKTSDYIDNGGTLASYITVHTTLQDIKSDKDDEGNSINGTASGKKAYYIMNSNLTESQKNWFLADMSDAQPTVEELSLLDDDQNVYNYYFGLNSENKEKFTNFAKAGISQSNYIKFKDTEFKSDKNSEGKTISGSKKRKIINFVNDLPLSVAEKAIYIKSAYKTFDDYNNEIINYINSQDLNIDEKSSILEDLGFKIKGGRVYW